MSDSKGLILIADDEPNIVLLLRRLFEKDGFEVEAVSDGNAALEAAERLKPELILMDVMMPGLSGFEVVKLLRQNTATARIPTIFITAAARDPVDIARGLGLGADDYITKPFSPHELLARAYSKMRARQLEESLERRNRELEALVRIGREFNQRLNVDDLLDLVLSISTKELDATQAFICLFDQQGGVLAWRSLNDRLVSQEHISSMMQDKTSILGQILHGNKSVQLTVSDKPILDDCCYSAIGTRIVHHGALIGAIVLGHKQPHRYDEGHLRLLESLTEQAALAIRNAELYEELHHYALNLENMVADRTAELRAAQAQLVRSEKLASLGRLAAGIAHEVNNPLQAIRNCLELAIEDIDANRPVDKELLTIAEQDVQRIRRIIRQLLDFSRPGSGELRPIEPVKVVESVLKLVSRQLERDGIALHTRFAPTSLVLLNEDQFKQVVLNLILNAQEAMPNGGSLTVSVAQHGASEVAITFTDTGEGISEANLPRIFDPFFSTKLDGTGLGLAVSYGIVEGHGGRIEVESRENQGAKFTVILPTAT